MKRLIIAASAIVALAAAVPASAADLRVKAPPPPLPPPCAQFGGFYLGGQVGGAYYDHHWSDRDAWAGEIDFALVGDRRNAKTGIAGGVTGGWNWQTRCTVFGVEADYSWASVKPSGFYTDGDTGSDLETLSVSSTLRGFGTLRVRSGVVVDNLLIYVTGGLAFANFKRSWTLDDLRDTETPVAETFSHNRTRLGWTAGVGTEWAWAGNWSIKSEVLYMHFEKDDRAFTSAFFDPGELKRFQSQDSVWVSRIGLNYRWGAPVRAGY